ncbi:MAG TPA: hypothetical protein VJ112_01805 [Rhabdochlamydiaceae bacterium]|nr:hypothetical protein [Rhabdochlamydiaceae bacterium]
MTDKLSPIHPGEELLEEFIKPQTPLPILRQARLDLLKKGS